MQILILGGTGLTGTAIVAEAVERGHEVVSVHRGRSAGDPRAEQVVLDRIADGHRSLADREWDAVIDVSGYVPAVVQDALAVLGTPSTRWLFVSSVSVFGDPDIAGQDENAPLIEVSDAVKRAASDDRSFDWRGQGLYGACKVLCEDEVRAADVASATILRPCVIAGAHDSTWRFPYWVERAGRGGRIAAPAPREAPVAVVDARDLASFALRCVEESINDTFVLASDSRVTTMEALVESARAAWPNVQSEVVWIDGEQLRAREVEPWAALPFWLPTWSGSQGFNDLDASKARAAGFVARPFVDTAREVRRWLESCDQWPAPGITLTAEVEAMLVEE